MRRSFKLSLLSFPAVLLVGCAEGPVKADPAVVAALKERYVLTAEPADALTPLDWRDAQSAEGTAEQAPATTGRAVLVGQVGGMPNPWGEGTEPDFPWRAGQATFFLVDPSTAAEFADHADEAGEAHAADCPFCSREAASKASSIAVVTFAGDDDLSRPAAVDARELFGLKEGDLVVVRGVAALKGDVLMVEAEGLYRRP